MKPRVAALGFASYRRNSLLSFDPYDGCVILARPPPSKPVPIVPVASQGDGISYALGDHSMTHVRNYWMTHVRNYWRRTPYSPIGAARLVHVRSHMRRLPRPR